MTNCSKRAPRTQIFLGNARQNHLACSLHGSKGEQPSERSEFDTETGSAGGESSSRIEYGIERRSTWQVLASVQMITD